MVTYYSKAWLEAGKEALNNSEKHLKQGKKLNGIFDFRILDGPDGKDRRGTWEFENGKCLNVSYECQPAPWTELREMPLDSGHVGRISCPFSLLAKLNKGEMSPMKAFTTPEYILEGQKMKFITMMTALNSWNEHVARIECNYDFQATDNKGNEI